MNINGYIALAYELRVWDFAQKCNIKIWQHVAFASQPRHWYGLPNILSVTECYG